MAAAKHNYGGMWENEETTFFFSVWAESEIQNQLMGAVWNIRVYEKVAKVLADNGFTRTPQQCCNIKIRQQQLEREQPKSIFVL
ncbi:UNVERIFIED_CONTAM: hypothetical protein FKN15_047805 [Acipenser sinensis]